MCIVGFWEVLIIDLLGQGSGFPFYELGFSGGFAVSSWKP